MLLKSHLMLTCNSPRLKEIKEANPDASAKELLTLIGETWRKMSEEEKKPYQDMVKVSMIKYEEQMKSYKDLCANSPVDMPTPDTYTPKQTLDTQEIEQAMNIQENQDTHNPYFYGEQQPSQVVKQDLLLYEPPIQENCKTSDSGSSQEVHNSPVILKNKDHNSGNLLLCQPFEPSNGNNNIGNIDMEGSGHWFQDDSQFQDPTNYVQQQYNEYQQIPHEISQQKILQDNSRQISRQEYYQKQMSQHHQQQMAQELSQQRALCHQMQKQQMMPSVQQEMTQQQEMFVVSNEIGQPPPYNDQNVNWNGVRPEVGGAAV
ncbi:hypothetical protein C2G38_1370517 [Gigaspora rosea]|uniref:HMG box domain-containing protein n=1 Tax=Gigaspora rosea TaxID=44941 RepID=A0A397VB04_9GLOM|nr:hypothetical protein C2G38_1370517 [Gigaspora rosea]